MNLDSLFGLLHAAQLQCGHREYVVVGSLSVLGMAEVAAIPAGMTMSIDADCYTQADPSRIFDLQGTLGEGSAYHHAHGIYLDPVSPKLPTLPEGWEQRLISVQREGVTARFLEPNDAAVSKLARAEPRDLRWVRAGLAAGIVSLPALRLRMRSTTFLDAEEEGRAVQALKSLAQTQTEAANEAELPTTPNPKTASSPSLGGGLLSSRTAATERKKPAPATKVRKPR